MLPAQRKWLFATVLAAVFLGFLIQVPQILILRNPDYHGILLPLNSDEEVYVARVQEVLHGNPSQVAEAAVGAGKGTQPALLEWVIGMVFRPTGLSAPVVLQIMDTFTVFFFTLLLWMFFRRCGFTDASSFVATLLICLIQFYNLNRPIHQGLSLFFVLFGMLLFMKGAEEKKFAWAVPGSILLGLSFGDYFWSWSFVCVWLGLYVLSLFFERRNIWRDLRFFIPLAVIFAATALPFILHLLFLSSDPLFAEAQFRSGMYSSHLPESWAYSILFTVMAGASVYAFFYLPETWKKNRNAIVITFTFWILIHQQLVHGQVFVFVSHYLMPMSVAAMCAVLLALHSRKTVLIISAAAACMYLLALSYDGRYVYRQFFANRSYESQHLASAVPFLQSIPRSVILSDPDTSMLLPGITHHNVVWFLYLQNVLMSHEDIAIRYCMTQIPELPARRRLEEKKVVWPASYGAFPDDTSLHERETALLTDACKKVDASPAEWIEKLGIQYVLWDEARYPQWDLQRLQVPLKKVGEGGLGSRRWSLWKISN